MWSVTEFWNFYNCKNLIFKNLSLSANAAPPVICCLQPNDFGSQKIKSIDLPPVVRVGNSCPEWACAFAHELLNTPLVESFFHHPMQKQFNSKLPIVCLETLGSFSKMLSKNLNKKNLLDFWPFHSVDDIAKIEKKRLALIMKNSFVWNLSTQCKN